MSFRLFFRSLIFVFMTTTMAFQTGCVVESLSGGGSDDSSSSTDGDGGGNGGEDISPFEFEGCIDGVGISTNRIRINFEFPTNATSVQILRNGNQIAEFTAGNVVNTHDDNEGLVEGATYLYTCTAVIEGLTAIGSRTLELSTIAVNVPNFSGIDSAVAQGPNSTLVSWTRSVEDNPVSANAYQVFANVGDTVDFSAPPRATVNAEQASFLIENLGDELNYSFGVRACAVLNTDGTSDRCEVNVAARTVSTPDGGVPTTPGATALNINNGVLEITAPWVESNGGLARRYIYIRRGPTGGTDIGNYVLERTILVGAADRATPPTTLEFNPLQEGETYHVIVQDEDPSTGLSAVTTFQTITATDITPPSFGGVTAVNQGTPADTVLNLSWTAIAEESVDPVNGGSTYKILALNSPNPVVGNPCTDGLEIAELNVSDFTAGAAASHDLTGLNERTFYSICIRAEDAAGNISSNNNSLQRNTLDITAPDFIGVQTLSYDNQTANLNLSWNSSTAEDIDSYRVTVWVNSLTPPPTPTQFFRSHVDFPTGTAITSSEFTLADNDEVYVNVEACDGTSSPFGTQNCSSTNVQRTVTVPDVTPPPNFLGIRGPTDILTPAEGEFTVQWTAPADFSDYRGFRVYQVEPATNAISLLQDCPCIDNGCSDALTQCTVQGLEPFRTFRLHVRAYDEANNETIYLDPAVSFTDRRTTDTNAPTFASGLQAGPAPDYTLTWSAGVDNQFATEPGAVITYNVYQNITPFDFTNPVRPTGNLVASTTDLTFTDSNLQEAVTYFYTVCAEDASGNTTCDQAVQSFTVADVTDPVITDLRSTKTIQGKVWELEWEMSDNISATTDITVDIHERVSVAGDLATTADPRIYSGSGTDVLVTGDSASTTQPATLDPLSGPEDLNRQINYLVVVRDQEGNEASANVGVISNNALTIASVRRTDGNLAGGDTIIVTGSGFSSSVNNEIGIDTEILVGGNPCTGVSVESENAITCSVPAATVPGSVEVRARTQVNSPASAGNRRFSEQALSGGYTYNASPVLCDDPGSWGLEFAAGAGTSTDPYIICDLAHLNSIRPRLNSGANYQLAANLDLSGVTFNPLGNRTLEFVGRFNGDGHIISNWTFATSGIETGFFGVVQGDVQISNFGLVNLDVTGGQTVGGLIGAVQGGTGVSALFTNVFATGSVVGSEFVGGLIGRKENDHDNFNIVNSYFVGDVAANGPTGYSGGIAGFLGTDNGGFFQNLYSEGNMTGSRLVGGLFGNLGDNKQLIDSFSRANVSAVNDSVGGLAGDTGPGASITNSFHESGAVSGTDNIGGLVGLADTITITDSFATSVVTSTGRAAGGVIGSAVSTTMSDLSSTATHNLNNASGGLVGEMTDSTLTRSFATGGVVSLGSQVGGLVGRVFSRPGGVSSITQSYSEGFLDTTGSQVGGLVGSIETLSDGAVNLSEVFSRADVGREVTSNILYGGLVGVTSTVDAASIVNISNCYATGAVQAGSFAGGILGGFGPVTNGQINIDRCYAASLVSGNASNDRAGFIGRATTSLHTISRSFYDREASEQSIANFGAFNSGPGGAVTGQTTAEMQDFTNNIYTAPDVDWDFTSIWNIPASTDYPQLQFETSL